MSPISSKEALQIAKGFEDCNIKSTAHLFTALYHLEYEHAARLYEIFSKLSVHHVTTQLSMMAYGEEVRPRKTQ